MRTFFWITLITGIALSGVFWLFWPVGLYFWLIWIPWTLVGLSDLMQTRHAIKANFPVIGHFRYLFEAIRPEINQYFVESNTDGRPFSREQRSVVYQRAKKELDTVPFGTQQNVYALGYEFVNHSLYPTHIAPETLRVLVGGEQCTKPYLASILNISAMSYGSLSTNAILALNGGAKDGGFAHNTGEGGVSPYHLEPGGDIIWQIGTGYFGCRTEDGRFDAKLFQQRATHNNVKMIEIKLSQGAKPGHGGILSGKKVNAEIAQIRNVPIGKDVISPPGHSAFSDPEGLLKFVAQLRDLSGGKPVGIKLCLGHKEEFLDLVNAMVAAGLTPDYISVDGSEGGTGAAPLEFTNYIGTPGYDALVFVVDTLKAHGLRERIKVFASGKVTTGFDVVRLLCLGADVTYAARSMMLALGCIQALRCNSNKCPTGVATQDPKLVKGLHVPSKRERVKNFHAETIHSVAHIVGAMGLTSHRDLQRKHLMKRISSHEFRSYDQITAV